MDSNTIDITSADYSQVHAGGPHRGFLGSTAPITINFDASGAPSPTSVNVKAGDTVTFTSQGPDLLVVKSTTAGISDTALFGAHQSVDRASNLYALSTTGSVSYQVILVDNAVFTISGAFSGGGYAGVAGGSEGSINVSK